MNNFDYLIIGGGSAGCIVAKRLADANIGSVCLLEAGAADEGNPVLTELSRLDQQDHTTEWGFEASPLRDSANRIGYARARMLGGCGNHNDCAFIEPTDRDLDRWASLGADGWSAADMQPYLDRVRSRVAVEYDPPVNAVSRRFIRAGLESGLEPLNFRSGVRAGVGVFPLNAIGDQRQAASQAYLHPLDELPDHLAVHCKTRATRLVIERGRAVGCETSAGAYRANREVILCCGSIQTPQLLMLSGIGSADQLKRHGVPVVRDLPGVGENLLDHVAANLCLELNAPMPEWRLTPCEAVMMLNLEGSTDDPELLYHFVLRMREKYVHGSEAFGDLNGVKLSPNVTRPRSRGRLTLRSADINDAPHIDLNYFSDPDGADMQTLIHGLRRARDIANTPAMREIIRAEVLPGPDITSDSALATYIRGSCETVYHPAGTCRMGSESDHGAVVNAALRVSGVENLRVADASVFPSMVTVNINNTVMMVAEKAAALIADKPAIAA